MKLLNSFGPNPRLVRMFMIEKGIELPSVEHDLLGGENRAQAYTAKNPAGQLPSLELDDGTIIAETIAICEYLEDKHPNPPLVGATPEEKAEERMWQRRVELNITEHMLNGFRFAEGIEIFRDRLVCRPEAADGLKAIAADRLEWLDKQLEGKHYLCGDRFTLADIFLYGILDFAKDVGQPFAPGLKNLTAWFDRVKSRPSAAASLHPGAAQVKMAG